MCKKRLQSDVLLLCLRYSHCQAQSWRQRLPFQTAPLAATRLQWNSSFRMEERLSDSETRNKTPHWQMPCLNCKHTIASRHHLSLLLPKDRPWRDCLPLLRHRPPRRNSYRLLGNLCVQFSFHCLMSRLHSFSVHQAALVFHEMGS